MASELIVQTLKGPTTGANANKVIIPSGQTLDIDAWTPPAGTVLQVAHGGYTTSTTTNSTSYANHGLSKAITPASSSSTFLVVVEIQARLTVGDTGFGFKLIRTVGGTDTAVFTSATRYDAYSGTAGGGIREKFTWTRLDSPSTTNEVTYKVQVATYNANSVEFQDDDNLSTITVMEIAG